MIGSVFRFEAARVCRGRWRDWFRRLYAYLLLLEFLLFLYSWNIHAVRGFHDVEAAWGYYGVFAAQTLLLILLTTPAVAAGSIADDKSRGTLALVLTTPLSAAEVILGKWLAHVLQALLLAVPVAPILAVLSVLGGMHPGALLACAVESVLLAMALAAAALLASVWARRTAGAVLAVYLTGAGVLAGLWWAGLDTWLGLLSFLEPQNQLRGRTWGNADSLAALACLASLCAVCLALAAWRLRPAHAAQLAGARRPGRLTRWLARPPVGNTPVRWKERYVGELGLLSCLRALPRRLKLAGVALLSLLAGLAIHGSDAAVLGHGLLLILVPGLVVAVRASGVITAEREKQTWEALLLSPLKASDLVRGKLWGVIDGVRPYLLAYLLPSLGLAVVGGLWSYFCLIYCWLAAWAFLYYLGAHGLYWSTQSASSWHSLFQALSSAALNIVSRSLLTVAICAFLVQVFILLPMLFFASSFFVGVVQGYALFLVLYLTPLLLLLFAEAENLLQRAEDYIAANERGGQMDISIGSLGARRG